MYVSQNPNTNFWFERQHRLRLYFGQFTSIGSYSGLSMEMVTVTSIVIQSRLY